MSDFLSKIQCIEEQGLIINSVYQAILKEAGLNSFDALWNFSGGKLIKKTTARSVVRLSLKDGERTRFFYLKRHYKDTASEGRKEFDNICEFRAAGIPVIHPVAAGEKAENRASLLLTEGFEPLLSLENLFKSNAQFCQRMENEAQRRILLEETARFARKMHDAGLNHCDFNSDHLLVDYSPNAEKPDIIIYDLQRVRRNPLGRFRWIIKSLAEFAFSLPKSLLDDNALSYLLMSYKDKKSLNFTDRLQLLWIKKKIEKIRRHTEKHPYHSGV